MPTVVVKRWTKRIHVPLVKKICNKLPPILSKHLGHAEGAYAIEVEEVDVQCDIEPFRDVQLEIKVSGAPRGGNMGWPHLNGVCMSIIEDIQAGMSPELSIGVRVTYIIGSVGASGLDTRS